MRTSHSDFIDGSAPASMVLLSWTVNLEYDWISEFDSHSTIDARLIDRDCASSSARQLDRLGFKCHKYFNFYDQCLFRLDNACLYHNLKYDANYKYPIYDHSVAQSSRRIDGSDCPCSGLPWSSAALFLDAHAAVHDDAVEHQRT